MASFYGHFSTGVVLGAAYGAAGVWYGHFDWGIVFLAGVTCGAGSAALVDRLGSPSSGPEGSTAVYINMH